MSREASLGGLRGHAWEISCANSSMQQSLTQPWPWCYVLPGCSCRSPEPACGWCLRQQTLHLLSSARDLRNLLHLLNLLSLALPEHSLLAQPPIMSCVRYLP